MTAPRAVAITSLNQVEDKLRRNLNLAGDVGLQFAANMTPVVLAADATSPGNATYRGRRFAGNVTWNTPAAAWSIGFKAAESVVITDIHWASGGAAATEIVIQMTGPNTADPYTISTPFAPWAERLTGDTDYAPFLRSGLTEASVSIGATIATLVQNGAWTPNLAYDNPLMLTAGQKIVIRSPAVSLAARLNLYGYVF